VRRTQGRILGGVLALVLVVGTSNARGDGDSTVGPEDRAAARQTVREAVDRALSALRDDSLSSDERLLRVEEVAWEHFDFDSMSRLALARHWKRFSPAQRESFESEFRVLLARRYGSRLERYSNERVEVLGDRVEPRGDVTVRTVVVGGNFEGVLIDYRLRRRGDTWRAIDVVIEGVSLLGSYRSQFGDLLGRETPDQLIARLHEKNAALEDE